MQQARHACLVQQSVSRPDCLWHSSLMVGGMQPVRACFSIWQDVQNLCGMHLHVSELLCRPQNPLEPASGPAVKAQH